MKELTGGGASAASFFAPFFKENITKDEEKEMKYKIFTATALLGSVFAELFGGWDRALQTLMIFMAVDILIENEPELLNQI